MVLVNFMTHPLASEGFILEIAHYLKRKSWIGCLPHFILRFAHSLETAQGYLTQLPVQILTSLDEAVNQAVSLSKKSKSVLPIRSNSLRSAYFSNDLLQPM